MLRPEVNRFVAGRRTYAHNEISISFVVKVALTDEAPESEVRLVFSGHETVEQVRDLVNAAVRREHAEDDEITDHDAHRAADQRIDPAAVTARPLRRSALPKPAA